MKAYQNIFNNIFIYFISLVILTGCNIGLPRFKTQVVTEDSIEEMNTKSSPTFIEGHHENSISVVTTVTQPVSPKFCSPLSFSGVTWNKSFSLVERRSFAIALSITGGFEGRSGWSNLTNNFDGQGMSCGLLNQTLGTGSLQPLMINMLSNFQNDFINSFSAANYKSVSNMLNQYKSATGLKLQSLTDDEELDLIYHESELPADLGHDGTGYLNLKKASAATNQSVQWAVQNLYLSNNSFKPEWRTQIEGLLKNKNYVSLQIAAAEKIHARAMSYMNRIGLIDLRTYLLMFDIVTQNGAISDLRWNEWENVVRVNKITDSTIKLKKLIDIRLQDVKPAYVADVRSRKYAIIDGVGKVHGKQVNLPASYCYKQSDVVK